VTTVDPDVWSGAIYHLHQCDRTAGQRFWHSVGAITRRLPYATIQREHGGTRLLWWGRIEDRNEHDHGDEA
jgi:hypothetical protein